MLQVGLDVLRGCLRVNNGCGVLLGNLGRVFAVFTNTVLDFLHYQTSDDDGQVNEQILQFNNVDKIYFQVISTPGHYQHEKFGHAPQA